jgi:hypothetical protein
MAYTVELWRPGESGIERTLSSHEDVSEARTAYRGAVAAHPDRLIMLCNKAMVLARSDRGIPEK